MKNKKKDRDMYDWDTILKLPRHIYVQSSFFSRAHLLVRAFLRCFFFSPRSSLSDEKVDFLFFRGVNREDYVSLFDSVCATCNHSKNIYHVSSAFSFNMISLRRILIAYKGLCELYGKESFLCRLYLLFNMLIMLGVRDVVFLNKFKILVVFADMQPQDNLLVQEASRRGLITVTMQHALYFDTENSNDINKINFESIVSQYFLAWGEDTTELLRNRCPRMVKVFKCGKFLTPALQHARYLPHDKRILVILDGEDKDDYNLGLIHMVKSLKGEWDVCYRIHPSSRFSRYSALISREDTTLDLGAHCFIGHTSTMLLELAERKMPVLFWKTELLQFKIGDANIFRNVDELFIKLRRVPLINTNRYFSFSGDEAKKPYQEFFDVLSKRG